MNSILEQLYHGELKPQNDLFPTETEFKHWREKFAPLIQEQAPALNKKFDTMMDDLCIACRDSTDAMFYQGFSLAVKLITEALSLS